MGNYSRRTVLKLSGASGLMAAAPRFAFAEQNSFPEGFLWGVASAAAQVESKEGRGTSNWDVFAEGKGHIHDGTINTINTEFQSRYAEEFDMLSAVGVNGFRFSFAWPRIQPDGPGAINADGIATYDRIIDAMLERGIEPLATIFHWDSPLWAGDFRDRDITKRLADYTDIVTRNFGDRVGKWLAMNEPNTIAAAGYGLGIHAPGLASRDAAAAATHHLILAQALMIDTARANLPDTAKISTTINLQAAKPSSDKPEDVQAAKLADAYWNNVWIDPLFGRPYPEVWQPFLAPYVKDGDMETIAVHPNFVGMNNYCNMYVHADERSPFGFAPDLDYVPPGGVATNMYPMEPQAFTDMLLRIHNNYGAPEIYVTETGFALVDPEPADGIVDDSKRAEYLKLYLQAADAAIQHGVNLKGIFYWSSTDNWEWAEGFAKTFGLIQIDRQTLKRTPKKSLQYYGECARINGVA